MCKHYDQICLQGEAVSGVVDCWYHSLRYYTAVVASSLPGRAAGTAPLLNVGVKQSPCGGIEQSTETHEGVYNLPLRYAQ